MSVIGIDLGTTNSVGAHHDGKETRVLSPQADGLVPSVVFYRKPRKQGTQSEILVGQAALDQAARDPENAIFSIKRLMGLDCEEETVEALRLHGVSYSIVRADDPQDRGVRVMMGGKSYSPVEISAMILRKIKQDAEKVLGPVTHAVITVPAYFKERQRYATRKAGEAAGLVVKKIIDEPSSAAIAYGFAVSKGARNTLLVFDLGGGTFDVSIILTVRDPEGLNHFHVLEICGDTWLGGDDFDRKIVAEFVEQIKREYDGLDLSGDRVFQFQAKRQAEQAKKTLSEALEAEVSLTAFKAGEILVDSAMPLTRARFEELIQPEVDRCMEQVRKALKNQNMSPKEVDLVLMVGGSTLVPLVFDAVANLFGKDKVRRHMPFQAVALGAGILAATQSGIECPNPECKEVNEESATVCRKCSTDLAAAAVVGSTSVTEVSATSFGISAVKDGKPDAFAVIIPKNTVYPLERPMRESFVTTADNFVRVPVFEGLDAVASKNDQQGVIQLTDEDFRLKGVDAPVGTPVEVFMNYSPDRTLQVKVQVKGVAFERAFKHGGHDRQKTAGPPVSATDISQLQARLDRIIRVAENFQGQYVTFMEERELRRLRGDIEAAEKVMANGLPREMEDAFQRLVMTLNSCGVASQIFIAEQMTVDASPGRSRQLSDAIRKLKLAWAEGDKQRVTEITGALRAALAAEEVSRRAQGLAGQQDFEGLLKLRD